MLELVRAWIMACDHHRLALDLHPALVVVLIYPLIGMVVLLAWQTRQRLVAKVKHLTVVGRDHSDLGRWLAAGVVILVLIA